MAEILSFLKMRFKSSLVTHENSVVFFLQRYPAAYRRLQEESKNNKIYCLAPSFTVGSRRRPRVDVRLLRTSNKMLIIPTSAMQWWCVLCWMWRPIPNTPWCVYYCYYAVTYTVIRWLRQRCAGIACAHAIRSADDGLFLSKMSQNERIVRSCERFACLQRRTCTSPRPVVLWTRKSFKLERIKLTVAVIQSADRCPSET